MARPWSPDLKHTDRERWLCIYPAYVNSSKSIAEGRRIPKTLGVPNPTYQEIRDICAAAGFVLGVENKVYPRELYPRDLQFRGRIRVQIKDESGQPVNEKFPNKNSVLLYIGEMLPKLKSRAQAAQLQPSQSQQPQQQQQSHKKKDRGKKK